MFLLSIIIHLITSSLYGSNMNVELPRMSIEADELAVVYKLGCSLSERIADYYISVRNIPTENKIGVPIPWTGSIGEFTEADFNIYYANLTAQIDSLENEIQVIGLTWVYPYVGEGNALNSVTATGVYWNDCVWGGSCGNCCHQYCTTGCYAGSSSTRPYTDYEIRPTIMLTGRWYFLNDAVSEANLLEEESFQAAKDLIDRGLLADSTFPDGTGYMLNIGGVRGDTRAFDFSQTYNEWDDNENFNITYIQDSDPLITNIKDRNDVMFYEHGIVGTNNYLSGVPLDQVDNRSIPFIGYNMIPNMELNNWLPGSVGDHLTSYGGRILVLSGGQASIMRFLDVGASGSFGTAVEPCAYTSKFPNCQKLVRNYFNGNTLIEAYWKSVNWVAQGVFIGDPLVRPWKPLVEFLGNTLRIKLTGLDYSGTEYQLQESSSLNGIYRMVRRGITYDQNTIKVIEYPCANSGKFYKLTDISNCESGYIGPIDSNGNCSTPKCSSCNSREYCDAPESCECLDGWSGIDCATPICSGGCADNDLCIGPNYCAINETEDDNCAPSCETNEFCSNSVCICAQGWDGPDCDEPICLNGCESNRDCSAPGTCGCAKGWIGEFCSLRDCEGNFAGDECSECLGGWGGTCCDSLNSEIDSNGLSGGEIFAITFFTLIVVFAFVLYIVIVCVCICLGGISLGVFGVTLISGKKGNEVDLLEDLKKLEVEEKEMDEKEKENSSGSHVEKEIDNPHQRNNFAPPPKRNNVLPPPPSSRRRNNKLPPVKRKIPPPPSRRKIPPPPSKRKNIPPPQPSRRKY